MPTEFIALGNNQQALKARFCLSAYNMNTHTVMKGKLMEQGLGTNPRAVYVGVDSLVRCNVNPSPTDVSPTENSWMLHPLDKVSLG